MLLLLIRWVTGHGLHVPAALSCSLTRMLLSAMTTLLLTIFLGPYVISGLYALKTGQSIRVEDCPLLIELHKKKKRTPTMGGILILCSMLIAGIIWMDMTHLYTWIFLGATVYLGLLGGWDDYLKMKCKNAQGISGKKKLALQVLLSLGVCGALMLGKPLPSARLARHQVDSHRVQYRSETLDAKALMGTYFLPFKQGPVLQLGGGLLVLSILFSALVITGSSNAVNLTDGLDGLASGLLVMSAGVLALFAFLSNHLEMSRYLNILYIEGSGEIAVYLSALVGACLGFLWYNGYPAQVFMGDTGSLAMGGILGIAAVMLRREFLLALVGGVFVIEVLSVMMQVLSYKYRDKKRIFLCAPLHHHFECKGWPETKVVFRFWIIAFILAMVGTISIKIQ